MPSVGSWLSRDRVQPRSGSGAVPVRAADRDARWDAARAVRLLPHLAARGLLPPASLRSASASTCGASADPRLSSRSSTKSAGDPSDASDRAARLGGIPWMKAITRDSTRVRSCGLRCPCGAGA
jgi:hypothetical protein